MGMGALRAAGLPLEEPQRAERAAVRLVLELHRALLGTVYRGIELAR
jgi:hypothetical protein